MYKTMKVFTTLDEDAPYPGELSDFDMSDFDMSDFDMFGYDDSLVVWNSARAARAAEGLADVGEEGRKLRAGERISSWLSSFGHERDLDEDVLIRVRR